MQHLEQRLTVLDQKLDRVRVFSPRDNLRSAFQLGMIPETDDWFVMLTERALVSHTYGESTVETIYAHLSGHLSSMRDALAELKRRVNADFAQPTKLVEPT